MRQNENYHLSLTNATQKYAIERINKHYLIVITMSKELLRVYYRYTNDVLPVQQKTGIIVENQKIYIFGRWLNSKNFIHFQTSEESVILLLLFYSFYFYYECIIVFGCVAECLVKQCMKEKET